MTGALSIRSKLAIGAGVTAVAAVLLVATAGDLRPAPSLAERIAAVPMEFWSAEALDSSGQPRGATRICADPKVRAGFELPLPRVNGDPCLVVGQPVATDGRFHARCVAGGQQYAVHISRQGDPAADFTVRMRAQPLTFDHPGVLQIIRYRKIGACPTDWHAGQAVTATGGRYDALDTRLAG